MEIRNLLWYGSGHETAAVLLPGGEPTKIVANVITFEM